ncbi:MAG: beta-ketoacyl synthase N-terminal-like domain-containing protein [Fibrobacterota bacterium]|nr:beta-ketoacyl synthase N-terminal-like domain-containing protein [Chitinispirillaceae bacterium]
MIKGTTVAITGIGIVTPSVHSYADCREDVLKNGKILKTIESIPLPQGQNARELRRLSKLVKMAASAADQALTMSGADRTGMAAGVALTHGSTSFLAEFHDLLFEYGADSASPAAFSNGVTNAPLSTISTLYKLTSGGITFTGLESSGIELLNNAAESVYHNEYASYLAGSAEEYSPIAEKIYQARGWYNGITPPYLPSCKSDEYGLTLSEGSAFVVFEKLTESNSARTLATYTSLESGYSEKDIDLILSGASGGPQDSFELETIMINFENGKKDVAFTSSVFGNCFALNGVLSVILACKCIQENRSILPYVQLHPSIKPGYVQCDKVKNVLVTSSSRDGQESHCIISALE